MKKIFIICTAILLLGVVIAGGITAATNYTKTKQTVLEMEKRAQEEEKAKKDKFKEEINKEKTNNEIQETVDEDFNKIKVEVEVDDVYIEGKRKFLIHATNTSEYPFKGELDVTARGVSLFDSIHGLGVLAPGQTKTFISKGNVESGSTFHTTLRGNFLKTMKNEILNYEIVRKYGGNGMMTYFVYITDFSDANMKEISKEIKDNYGKNVHDLEIRFTNVHDEPTLDDSLAMFSIHPMNKELDHKLVWFTKDGDIERVIASIP